MTENEKAAMWERIEFMQQVKASLPTPKPEPDCDSCERSCIMVDGKGSCEYDD